MKKYYSLTILFVLFVTSANAQDNSLTSQALLDSAAFEEMLANLPEEKIHKVKMSLYVGYYGDRKYAPMGFVINAPIQEIGKLDLNIAPSFKYWKDGKNYGREFATHKSITNRVHTLHPDQLFVSYRKLHYEDVPFELEQVKGFLVNELPYNFSIDVGVIYNKLDLPDEAGQHHIEKYLAPSLGVGKPFYYNHGESGIYTNVTYHKDHIFYEAGLYTGVGLFKITSVRLMARYYHYDFTEGVTLSAIFFIFGTRLYCCHTTQINYDFLNLLK